jgi:hypothetical protein
LQESGDWKSNLTGKLEARKLVKAGDQPRPRPVAALKEVAVAKVFGDY